jgi:4-alpha-glucanotransferase
MSAVEHGPPASPVLDRRRAGVLLHPTSLPGGDLGADAARFIEFLADAGFSVWQALPLGPTHSDGSPYHCLSAHAGNPRLISAARLVEDGWLEAAAAADPDTRARLGRAHQGFVTRATPAQRAAFDACRHAEAHWLDDYALFEVLRKQQASRPWWQWPGALRDREPAALAAARAQLGADIERVCFEQFAFARQWRALRELAAAHDLRLFGDMPIFVAHDSAEVWAHREYFKLDAEGQPTVVAGVPPDYFSATGQRWGNPLYDWTRMAADGFAWWAARLKTELGRFDLVRIDHFRGFAACWEIPAADPTAVNGRWVEAPGERLFDALLAALGRLPLVAEDLGVITPDVVALRTRLGLPGMKVLQFAFDGGADNPYLPHAHSADAVVYTGTHDNDTTLSWFEQLPAAQQERVLEYLGQPREPMPRPLTRAALASVAPLAILPLQDVLELGAGHRMNTPGTCDGNWRWRFDWQQVEPELVARWRELVRLYGREIPEPVASSK